MHYECLSIVCSYGGAHFIHDIHVRCDGTVEGNLYDQLPMGHKILQEITPPLIWATASPPRDFSGTHSLFVMGKHWGTDSFNQIVELNPQSLTKNLNWIPPNVNTCSFFISTSTSIYVVTVPPIAIECLSISNMDKDLEWKSVPLPDCFQSGSLIEISGYVVVEELGLILFCIAFRKQFEFYALDTRAHQWFHISIKTSDYVRYEFPYYPCDLPLVDVYNIYPFYGRAEYVDGIIYGCLGRDLVTYCFTGTEESTFLLQLAVVFSLSKHASAYKKAPFGVPRYHSRCITHIQNRIFCLVETAEEPGGETFFRPVYITTFESSINTNNFDEREGRIRVLQSTIRFVEAKDTYLRESDAEIICCYSLWPPESAGKRQRMMQHPCTPLPFDFEHLIHEMIPGFCEALIDNFYGRITPCANMLFLNFRHELKNFENPFVKFFRGLMEYKVNGGPPPDPFPLLENSVDVGGLICDGVKLFDCSRSVFMVSTHGPSCDFYELKVSEYGFICGGLISKGIGVEEEKETGASFGFLISSSTGHTVCLLSENLRANTIANCYVVNMIKKEVVKVPSNGDPQVRTKRFVVIGYKTKFYVVSDSNFIDDIPEPPFQCFDPVSHIWQTLKAAPFHSDGSNSDVVGYAFVEDHILISLYPDIEFYSYDICKGEWAEVLFCKNNEDDAGVHPYFSGKAEYVNGRIYTYDNRTLFQFVVEKSGDALKLHSPTILSGLEPVLPPLNWNGIVFESMTYIGGGLFFLVETSTCSFLVDHQYACLTTFSINEHLDVQTHHSTVRVIDGKRANISYCFSDYDFERGHVDHY